MSKRMKRITMMLMVFVLAFGVIMVPSSAATKKLKNANWSTKKSYVKKKAVTVKKGTYTIKFGSKGIGYLKFKATKAKTYTFTLSNLKTSKSYGNGYADILVDSPYGNNSLTYGEFATKGGKTSTLWINTKSNTTGEMKYRFLKSRYAKMKLKKNQIVYMYMNFSGNNSIKLKIK